MNTDTLDKKIAIVSNSLPPDITGQSIVIYKLVSELPKDKYCLIRTCGKKSTNNKIFTKEIGKIHEITLDILYWLRFPRYKLIRKALVFLMQFYYLMFFPLSLLIRSIQIWRILRLEGCEILIGCTGDPYNLPASLIAAKLAGIPFIPYILDDFAYQLTGRLRKFSQTLASFVFSRAKNLIVTNEYIKKDYENRYGVKSIIIRNPVIMPNLALLDKKIGKREEENEIRIVYTGSVYGAQLDALKNLLDIIDEITFKNIKLYLYSSTNELTLKKFGLSTKSIVFHRSVPHSKINHILRQGDILFLPLAFNSPYPELIRTSSPGKTGEYLSIGKPILVHMPEDSFICGYFKHHNCGATVCCNDKEELKKILLELINNKKWQEELARNAIHCAQYDFNLEVVKRKFISLIKTISNQN